MAVAIIRRLEGPNKMEGLWHQVTLPPELAEKSEELMIMPAVVEQNLTGSMPIVIAHIGSKIIQILPETKVGKAVVLNVKIYVKYQRKKWTSM